MKLSEAIREGAKKRPQTKGYYANICDGQICTCALGAAVEGQTGVAPEVGEDNQPSFPTVSIPLILGFLGVNYRNTDGERYINPVTKLEDSLYSIITSLNDDYDWSRERISDWIEAIGM